MRRQLLATVSCLALTSVASAADLSARMPVKAPPLAVVQSWAGPYIGLNGGGVWHRQESDTFANGGVPYAIDRTVTARGGMFGVQAGYNWQSQNVVYGLEADIDWVGVNKSQIVQAPSSLTFTTKLNWLSTVRARIGLAAGRTLFFATGGLAVGGVKDNWRFSVSPTCCAVESNETRLGWTAGGGIEHFISNSNVTVKAEALYVDLGSRSQLGPGSTYTSRFKNTSVVGRLGVNLKW